jgi:hypothetical protein
MLASFVQLRLVNCSVATLTDAGRHPNPNHAGMRFQSTAARSPGLQLHLPANSWGLSGRRLGDPARSEAVQCREQRRSVGCILSCRSRRSRRLSWSLVPGKRSSISRLPHGFLLCSLPDDPTNFQSQAIPLEPPTKCLLRDMLLCSAPVSF